jgi:hypothetical protein
VGDAGFVFEEIRDGDWAWIGSFNMGNPWGGMAGGISPAQLPLSWTVDRRRSVALLSLGGGGHHAVAAKYWALLWGDEALLTGGDERRVGNYTVGLDVTYQLNRIFLRRVFEGREDEVTRMTHEAFRVHAGQTRPETVKSVEFVGEFEFAWDKENQWWLRS